jgi:hypothetical protein
LRPLKLASMDRPLSESEPAPLLTILLELQHHSQI